MSMYVFLVPLNVLSLSPETRITCKFRFVVWCSLILHFRAERVHGIFQAGC
jgi:hypothetical protein